jgi:hypothetical protein
MRGRMRLYHWLVGAALLGMFGACSASGGSSEFEPAGTAGKVAAGGNGGSNAGTSGQSGNGGLLGRDGSCERKTCAELGWACGYLVDACGNRTNCADEGRSCAANQVCKGGVKAPTECVELAVESCELCASVPDCPDAGQPTRLAGRVITPGRNDLEAANHLGVPNAVVYILRSNNLGDLPAISTGIPNDGTSCERCEEVNMGPVLTGAVTDATGRFVIEGRIPVGVEFVLVVKAGKFRRAVKYTLPGTAGCQTTTLPGGMPENPTRLPRGMNDGLAVNIPHIAVSTGQIDAMECVLEKMGIDQGHFGNPGGAAPQRVDM